MIRWAACILCLIPAVALAGSGIDLGSVAGVYKYSFNNGLVDGTTFRSTNILEIVKLSSRRAYIRTALEFYNGHTCDLSVVANVEGDALVYRNIKDGDRPCELKLVFDDRRIVLADTDGMCKLQYCGARGSFQGIKFERASRRTIRYMKRLRTSSDFAAALEEAGLRP